MTVDLYREATQQDATVGRLSVNGVFECYTLEDAVRDHTLAHETAIPAGRYEVIIDRSARFERMLPRLLKVPGFSGIRIHAGNDADDTEGCLCVGKDRGPDAIHRSKIALAELEAKVGDPPPGSTIEYVNVDPPRDLLDPSTPASGLCGA